MQYFKSIGGMVKHALAANDREDDDGNPIVSTDNSMTELESVEFKRRRIKAQIVEKYKTVNMANTATYCKSQCGGEIPNTEESK